MGRYAGVLAFHEDKVVLVRESYPAWGGSFDRAAAIEELARLPYEPLRVPAVAYLRDDASTKSWHFTV